MSAGPGGGTRPRSATIGDLIEERVGDAFAELAAAEVNVSRRSVGGRPAIAKAPGVAYDRWGPAVDVTARYPAPSIGCGRSTPPQPPQNTAYHISSHV
ncbi:unnamed protein product, partial [Iphiclides podalirius]